MARLSQRKQTRAAAPNPPNNGIVIFITLLTISLFDMSYVLLTSTEYAHAAADGSQLSLATLSKPDISSQNNNLRAEASPQSSTIQNVSPTCQALPGIQSSSGLSAQNPRCKKVSSMPEVEPSFHFGSFFPPERVMYHMTGALAQFQLMKEQVENKKSSVTLDVGSNQGFFSFYIAALGLDVHAFEINPENFEALQHGAFQYNTPEISKHVNLYHMGLNNQDGKFGISGGDYKGFLKASKDGKILSVQFDCFAHHRPDIFEKEISFVKIDVEGFEIRVLQGAKQSLFAPGRKIGSLLIEVGPSRWSRSGASLTEGIEAMTELSTHFQDSYVLLGSGQHCPMEKFKPSLSTSTPSRSLRDVQLYKLASSDWAPLLTSLGEAGSDCDFWFTNN